MPRVGRKSMNLKMVREIINNTGQREASKKEKNNSSKLFHMNCWAESKIYSEMQKPYSSQNNFKKKKVTT